MKVNKENSCVHVVFGAETDLGIALVEELLLQGVSVRAIVKSSDKVKDILPKPIVVEGDVLNPEIVKFLCRDAVSIYHCVHFSYEDYPYYMPLISKNILAASKLSKAVLVFPGTIINNYQWRHLKNKQRTRKYIESMYKEAHHTKDIIAIIPRFPILFGPHIQNDFFKTLFQNITFNKEVPWLGDIHQSNQILYLKDAAKLCFILAQNELYYGKDLYVEGIPITGNSFLKIIESLNSYNLKVNLYHLKGLLFRSWLWSRYKEWLEVYLHFGSNIDYVGDSFDITSTQFQYTPYTKAIMETLTWFSIQCDLMRSP